MNWELFYFYGSMVGVVEIVWVFCGKRFCFEIVFGKISLICWCYCYGISYCVKVNKVLKVIICYLLMIVNVIDSCRYNGKWG